MKDRFRKSRIDPDFIIVRIRNARLCFGGVDFQQTRVDIANLTHYATNTATVFNRLKKIVAKFDLRFPRHFRLCSTPPDHVNPLFVGIDFASAPEGKPAQKGAPS